MSISTKQGDDGSTTLTGGLRVSKSDLRVEAYGAIDELISTIGFARSICDAADVRKQLREIQQELFLICSAIATPNVSEEPEVAAALVVRLTEEVHRLESIEGILADWSIPGEHPVTAAIDVARATCRRAERSVVRLGESGVTIQHTVLGYLNRLSDWLWILGRSIELNAGIDSALRKQPGKRWSRAW